MSGDRTSQGWLRSLGLRWGLVFLVVDIYNPLRWLEPFRPGRGMGSGSWFVAQLDLQIPWGLSSSQFWTVAADALLAIPIACIWTVFDRRARSNAVIRELVHLGVRYSLAAGMIQYGADKVIGQQGIPQPAPLEWNRPLGEISTGQLMWTWLGYSPSFEFFAGVNESLGGILLLFRRTTLLGALLVLPVMIYVTALDMTFNVGPQARAATFMAWAVYLVGVEWRRVVGALILGRPTVPRASARLWTSPRLAQAGRLLWIVVVSVTLWRYVVPHVRQNADIGGRESPLCGAYRVERFMRNGVVVPESATDGARWRVVAINCFGDYIRIRRMDDAELLWSAEPGNPYRFLWATGHGYKYGDYEKLLAKTEDPRAQVRFKELPNYRSPHASMTKAPAYDLFTWNPSRDERDQMFVVTFVRHGIGRLALQARIDGVEIATELRRVDNESIELFRSRGRRP